MDPAALGVLIPIISIILSLSFAMLMVYLKYRRDSEALKLTHAERLAAIEKGIELPLPPPPSRLSQAAELREAWRSRVTRQRTAGLVLLFVGLTITLAMWHSGSEGYFWGMVPGSIGLALLVAAFIDARDAPQDGPPSSPPEAQPPEV